MDNFMALSSLVMDLKRTAIGLHRRSFGMSKRFSQEILKRKSEVNLNTVSPYIQKILNRLDWVVTHNNHDKQAEDMLMYSILIQNYLLKQQKTINTSIPQ